MIQLGHWGGKNDREEEKKRRRKKTQRPLEKVAVEGPG